MPKAVAQPTDLEPAPRGTSLQMTEREQQAMGVTARIWERCVYPFIRVSRYSNGQYLVSADDGGVLDVCATESRAVEKALDRLRRGGCIE